MAHFDDHLEKLMTFKVIADTGSFRGAATALRRTQPSLSRAVQVLETAVDAKLFERSVRGVRLSRQGELLYKLAERIASEVEATKRQLRRLEPDAGREIVVSCFESIAA